MLLKKLLIRQGKCVALGGEVAEGDGLDVSCEGGGVGNFHTDVVVGEAVHGSGARGVLEKDGTGLTDVGGIELVELLVAEGKEPLAALVLFLGTDGVGNLQGTGAWTLGVGEDVELADGQGLDESVGLFEVVGGLAARADNDIYADEAVGKELLDVFHSVAEEGGVVAAVHELENGVAA